jgi:ABC-2 type transport system ATP-binding protein
MTKKNIITVEALHYTYPNAVIKQLDEVTFTINEGARFGVFGPNGAGKTTLMHVMLGLLNAQHGKIHYDINRNADTCNSLYNYLGVVPQDFSFYEDLTLKENLDFFGAWYGLSKSKIKERTSLLTQTFGLVEFLNTRVKYFSGGMKRRVNLAIGVLHQPKILFLDEPTVGVDIQSRHSIIEYLLHINKEEQVTLIYTSHHLKEAQLLCSDFIFLDNGKIIQSFTLEQLNASKTNDLESLFLNLTGTEYRDE